MTSLASAIKDYGAEAYLFTVGEKGPHTSVVSVDVDGKELRLAIGRTARGNVQTNRTVSVLWPAKQPGGYSIIVNGEVRLGPEDDPLAAVEVTKSVFHRPGDNPNPDAGGTCSSDCKPLSLG